MKDTNFLFKSVPDESRMRRMGEEIAKYFKTYPLLEEVCHGLEPQQYPAAVFVAGGLMATLMTRCYYHFYFQASKKCRLNCIVVIIGDPTAGKSFANSLYENLATPMIESTKAAMDELNKWRQKMNSISGTNRKNGKCPPMPKVIIRVHPARTSNKQFINDMVNAKEMIDGEETHLHMFSYDSELDNVIENMSAGTWMDKQSLMLKSFHNELDGQAFVNYDSVTANFNVYWNMVYTGTRLALRKLVNAQNFGTGLFGRLTLIPFPSTHFKMISMEKDTEGARKRKELMRDWAYKLDKRKGELPLEDIVETLYNWTSRRMEDAKENHSQEEEMLLKRCAYHGLNMAAPFIDMRHWDGVKEDGDYLVADYKTDKKDAAFAELLCNIQYFCQQHYFYDLAELYFKDMRNIWGHPKTRKTLEAYLALPDRFHINDIMRCYCYKNRQSAYNRAKVLVEDHLADYDAGKGWYRKIKKGS